MPSRRLSTSAAGYGYNHRKLRELLAPDVALGLVDCWRCNERIKPGQVWDLGHDDDDRRRYRGAEHALKADCPANGNRSVAATRGNIARGKRTSRDWFDRGAR